MITFDLNIGGAWDNKIDWKTLTKDAAIESIKNSEYNTLLNTHKNVSIDITLSNNEQIHALNKEYRGKDKPTNILSFPMLSYPELQAIEDYPIPEILLGDLILSYEICIQEASEKNISIENHYQHLIIHGILHLLGYDHIEDKDADIMQALEIKALDDMGIDNPYEKG